MKGSPRSRRRNVFFSVLIAAFVCSLPGQCRATPVFHEDTQYQLNGSFFMGALGLLTVMSNISFLRYDSVVDKLIIDAVVKNSNDERFDLELTLGASRATDGGLEFAFPNGSFNPPTNGHTIVGDFSPRADFTIFGVQIEAGTLLPLFALGFPATILADGNDLVFSNWLQLSGAPLPINVVGNPRLTLSASSGVPEPMSAALLSLGIAGAARIRSRRRLSA